MLSWIFIFSFLYLDYVNSVMVTRQTDEWTLVFKAVTDGVGSPYELYKSNRTQDEVLDAGCLTCGTSHFKSNIINEWEQMEIIQVKVGIYKNNSEMAYFIFNGTESDVDNWFSFGLLLETNYEDINVSRHANKAGPYFSMTGDETNKNRFMITEDPDDCTGIGWLVVSELSTCTSNRNGSIVVLFGANKRSSQWLNDDCYSVADYMAIFVKRRSFEYHCKKYYTKTIEDVHKQLEQMKEEMQEYMQIVQGNRASRRNRFYSDASTVCISVFWILLVLLPVMIICIIDVVLCVRRYQRQMSRMSKSKARIKHLAEIKEKHDKINSKKKTRQSSTKTKSMKKTKIIPT